MYGILAGAMHKKGSFQNENTGEVIAYDNIDLVILIPPSVGGPYDPVEAVGQTTERSSKFAAENLSNVFGKDVRTLKDVESFIGKQVEYYFDGSKKICRVIVNG